MPSFVKKLAVLGGVGAALTAWRTVMLSINTRGMTDARAPKASTNGGQPK